MKDAAPLTPYNVTLGTRITALMEGRALRKEAVAVGVGVSWLTIHKIRTGHGCRSETLPRLAQYFGVSLDYLFGLTDAAALVPPPNGPAR